MKLIKLVIFHIKQFYKTYKTRKYKGDMDLLTYHCFRINKLWEYRFACKEYTDTI